MRGCCLHGPAVQPPHCSRQHLQQASCRMISAVLVASCLALLAPAQGFVTPIVSRVPGSEVRTPITFFLRGAADSSPACYPGSRDIDENTAAVLSCCEPHLGIASAIACASLRRNSVDFTLMLPARCCLHDCPCKLPQELCRSCFEARNLVDTRSNRVEGSRDR